MPLPILLVEDDATVSAIVSGYLESEGLTVDVVPSARDMLRRIGAHSHSLIMLDLGLPDEDGIALLRKLRAITTIPVMVVTARSGIETRLTAFELGAADILVKPFDPRELRHRALNLIQRDAARQPRPNALSFGRWRIQLAERTVASEVTGHDCPLTRVEFDLLVLLVQGKGRVFSRAQIIDAMATASAPESDRAVDTLVSRLRRKLSMESDHAKMIATVHGVGYRAVLP